jgi:phosphatidate cytidylyltransferase
VSSRDSGDGDDRDTDEVSPDRNDPIQPPLFDGLGDPAEYGVDDAGNLLDVGTGFADLWATGGDEIPDSDPIVDQPPALFQRGRKLFSRRGAQPSLETAAGQELPDPSLGTEEPPADLQTPSSPSLSEEDASPDAEVDNWLSVTDRVDHDVASEDPAGRKRRRFGWLRAQPSSVTGSTDASDSPESDLPGVEAGASATEDGELDPATVVGSDGEGPGTFSHDPRPRVGESPDELTRIPLIVPPSDARSTEPPAPVSGPRDEDDVARLVHTSVPPTTDDDEHADRSAAPQEPVNNAGDELSHDAAVFDLEGDDQPDADSGSTESGLSSDENRSDTEPGDHENVRVSSTLSVVPALSTASADPDDPAGPPAYSVSSFDDFAFDFEDLISRPEEPEVTMDPSGAPLAQWPDDSAKTGLDADAAGEIDSKSADAISDEGAVGERQEAAVDGGGTLPGSAASGLSSDEQHPIGTDLESNVIPELIEPVETGEADEFEHVELKPGAPVDVGVYTSEEYVQASTAEHAGLARAIARADEDDSEHAAIYAALPGMEDEVVGLDDVVDMTMEQESVDLAKPAPPSDIAARVGTGVGLIAVVALALLNPVTTGILAFLAFGLAALEYYTALQRAGVRPITWAGLLGIAGAFLGTWGFGLVAIPVAVVVSVIAGALFLSFKPAWPRPGANLTFTLLGVAWIGGSGALVFSILKSPDYRVLVAVLILLVVVLDVAQYFTGRAFGRRPLAPIVSPKKTVEGLVGGYVALVAAGLVLSRFALWDQATALVLVVAIGVVAPLGDLSVSVIKRSLRMKDMGVVLPGHGGVLDRIDALLFAIPAAWLVFTWAGLM